MIACNSIVVRRRGRDVVGPLTCEFAAGEISVITGRSGVGKSTLLEAIAGELRLRDGTIVIGGVRVKRGASLPALSTAYLPQESMRPRALSVIRAVVAFGLTTASLEQDPLLRTIKNSQIHTLSSGERRYLEARMILALDRQYYLLDEPFARLQPTNIERLLGLVASLRDEGRTVLVASQRPDDIPIASGVYELTSGVLARGGAR